MIVGRRPRHFDQRGLAYGSSAIAEGGAGLALGVRERGPGQGPHLHCRHALPHLLPARPQLRQPEAAGAPDGRRQGDAGRLVAGRRPPVDAAHPARPQAEERAEGGRDAGLVPARAGAHQGLSRRAEPEDRAHAGRRGAGAQGRAARGALGRGGKLPRRRPRPGPGRLRAGRPAHPARALHQERDRRFPDRGAAAQRALRLRQEGRRRSAIGWASSSISPTAATPRSPRRWRSPRRRWCGRTAR